MRANVFLAELGPKSSGSRNKRITHDFEGQNIFQILQSYVGKEEELKEISTDMYWLQKYILENDPGEGTSWWEFNDKQADKNRANKIGMYLKRLQKSENVTLGTTKAEDIVNKTGEFQTLIRKQRDLNAAVTLANSDTRRGPGPIRRVRRSDVDKQTAELAALAASTTVDTGGDVTATMKDGSSDTTLASTNQLKHDNKDATGKKLSNVTIAQDEDEADPNAYPGLIDPTYSGVPGQSKYLRGAQDQIAQGDKETILDRIKKKEDEEAYADPSVLDDAGPDDNSDGEALAGPTTTDAEKTQKLFIRL